MDESVTLATTTRQRILDIAARQFRAFGYAGVSLRGIAGEAGMKAGSLYYHFESKDEIVAAVLEIGIDLVHNAVTEAVTSLGPDAPADSVLRSAMNRHLSAFLTWSDYTSANVRIFGQVPEAIRAANLPARQRYEALWDAILERLSRDGLLRASLDIPAIRLFLLGAMNSTLEWFDPARGDIDALADKYADILLSGIINPTGAQS